MTFIDVATASKIEYELGPVGPAALALKLLHGSYDVLLDTTASQMLQGLPSGATFRLDTGCGP